MWREIKSILSQRKNFLLTTHVNPDGDGIGSACALMELLLALNKDVAFVCDSPIPQKFSFLDFHKKFEVYQDNRDTRDTEVFIVLDAHRKNRIGRLAKIAEDPLISTICIDHHSLTETFTPFSLIDSNACSVGAMVYSLFREFGLPINYEAAMGIYTSIICDTGRFSYSSTSIEAHKIAEECIKLGVNPDLIYSHLYQHVTLAEIKIFAQALQRMETYFDNRVIIQQIYLEDWEKLGGQIPDLEHIDLDYIHEFNKSIEDVDYAVLLRELPGRQVRVSIRSRLDVDMGKIMGRLGGGGHSKAAGVTWNGSMEEVKSQLLNILKDLVSSKVSHS
jgi:phosphoesterase RecJ-like protein